MIRSTLIALGIAILPAGTIAGQESAVPETEMIGPMVGAEAPAFEEATSTGDMASLESLAGENGTAIAFVRSVDWCPYCQKQARDLEAAREPLAEMGWSLAALSYDDPGIQADFASENGLAYTFVSDEDSSVIKAYHLLNEEMREGSKYWGIPHPAIVFIRADGTVAAVLREEGYKKRPAVGTVIDTARLLNEMSDG